MRSPRVVVVGAGMGGLVAALVLAGRADVTVVEKAATPGGKLRQLPAGEAMIDAGPTVFTLRSVFDEIFAAAGARLDDHVILQPAALLARHAWNERERLDLHADPEKTADAIGAFAGAAEAKRYRAFCTAAARIYRTVHLPFIRAPQPSLAALLSHAGWRGLGDLFAIKPFTSMWNELGRYFHDPRLRQLYARYATYCGSSPFAAPATLMLVAHVEREGVWLVQGGMHRLAQAIAHLAGKRGVKFVYGRAAKRAHLERGRIAALELEDSERIAADAIVFNADSAKLGSLVGGSGATPLPARHRSLSALTMTFLARAEGFPLAHHNVFFSDDYPCEFEDIFKRGRLPRAPTIYLCAQDRDEFTAAPASPGKIFLLVNAPPTGDVRSFEPLELATCEKQIFSRMERCGLKLADWKDTATVTTPADFERLFPGTGGALYGRASHGWMASFRRPGVKTNIPGLYRAGGSVHPGPGIPMAALSGKMAAEALLAEFASTGRLHPVATPGGTSMR